MQFSELNLSEQILSSLNTLKYTSPTPIQEQAIPIVLQRKDLLACAQTGTGKTAAFALPIIKLLSLTDHHQNRDPLALILAPTRELALQISESIASYAKGTSLRHTVVFGGVSIHNQIKELKSNPHIVVATPGRLIDLLQQKKIFLSKVKHLVLDEADRMLDMGFIKDIEKIIRLLPARRQTLLFSATMPSKIEVLAQKILDKPHRISVAPTSSTAETINQTVYPVEKSNKIKLLTHLIKAEKTGNILVFSRTKHGADRIVKRLTKQNITAKAIHGNKTQPARQKALNSFKKGDTQVLIATDIAARGIDVQGLNLVINYDLPNEPETYVHRIGRTGRAGESGRAYSFCDVEENAYLQQIQKLINIQIPVFEDHPFWTINTVKAISNPPKALKNPKRKKKIVSKHKKKNLNN